METGERSLLAGVIKPEDVTQHRRRPRAVIDHQRDAVKAPDRMFGGYFAVVPRRLGFGSHNADQCKAHAVRIAEW